MLDGTIPVIDVQEAYRRLSQPATDQELAPLLVDVREVNEFLEARAEGALLFPLSEFMARHRELPVDRPLLMICAAGGRSAQATAFLLANGWDDVANVAGGTGSWLAAGLPTRTGALGPDELERGP